MSQESPKNLRPIQYDEVRESPLNPLVTQVVKHIRSSEPDLRKIIDATPDPAGDKALRVAIKDLLVSALPRKTLISDEQLERACTLVITLYRDQKRASFSTSDGEERFLEPKYKKKDPNIERDPFGVAQNPDGARRAAQNLLGESHLSLEGRPENEK